MDIRELDAKQVCQVTGLQPGELDLLAGCPPCQGFSTLKTLNGREPTNDPRNDLVFSFMELAKSIRPKAVLMENVPGLLLDYRIDKVLSTLARLGYDAEARVVDAAEYGVPQRRRRMVLMASRVGRIEFPEIRKKRQTVRTAIGHLKPAGKSGDPLHDLPERRRSDVINRIKAIPADGGSRTSLPKKMQLACHQKSTGFKDVYGRMRWDDVAPTMTTGCFNPSKGRFLHPEQHRAITMREAAILQSFPMSYKFLPEVGKVKLAELIGNALPPKMIRSHAEVLRRSL